jgi:hypothetical protein
MNHRPGARKALITAAAAAMLVVSTGIVSVLAVHDDQFQLDGDVQQGTGATTRPVDWDTLFNADTSEKALPTGFKASTFAVDFQTTTKRGNVVFSTADSSTFTTGSKDTLDITPGWQCAASNNVLTKNDIMNTYAAAYTDDKGTPATGDDEQFLYFGLERNGNNGDANVAFWFLQGEASCDGSNGTAAWTGHHVDGDVLIVSAFTNGGGVSNITAYRWSDADGEGGTPGFLNTSPVGNGGDCQANLGGDAICATTNGSAAPGLNANITTPWLTSNGTNLGHTLAPSEFFEGGINLTNLGLGNKCFNTFVGDTRSSQSLTATIFDYASGVLGECTSSTSTQAKDGAGANLTSVAIPATGTLTVKDTATVDVEGITTFDGSVQFYLCGPSTTVISTCAVSGTGAGVAIGSAHPITSDGSVDQTATLTSAGYYCWHAVFSGDADAGVPGSADSGANECFQVTPLQSSLVTQATTGPVDFGQPISDTVTIGNTANKPGTNGVGPGGTINATRGGAATGDITLRAYGPDSCTTVAFGPVTLGITGNGIYGGAGSTFEFTPSAPGQYVFVASYAGDSPNTLGVAATACSGQPLAEKVTVQQIPTEITTTPSYFPQDSATVTSSVVGNNLPAGGTLIFRLYNSSANCLLHGDTVGQGGLLYRETVTLGAAAHSQTGATNNQTARVSATGSVWWRVTYATGDTAHTGRQSDCVENINATLTGDSGPGTLFP